MKAEVFFFVRASGHHMHPPGHTHAHRHQSLSLVAATNQKYINGSASPQRSLALIDQWPAVCKPEGLSVHDSEHARMHRANSFGLNLVLTDSQIKVTAHVNDSC